MILTRQQGYVAKVSVIPPSVSDSNHCKNNLFLQAVNNSLIVTYGSCTFQWVFIIANVKNPIIGADFLCYYSDVGHNRLVDNITVTSSGSGCPRCVPQPYLVTQTFQYDF